MFFSVTLEKARKSFPFNLPRAMYIKSIVKSDSLLKTIGCLGLLVLLGSCKNEQDEVAAIPNSLFDTQLRRMDLVLQSGWHTYNPQTMLGHVWMPWGFSVQLSLKNNKISARQLLSDTYPSNRVEQVEIITPGERAWDGSYTQLTIAWEGAELQVETAVEQEEWVMLVTPLNQRATEIPLIIQAGMLWNKPGLVVKDGDLLKGKLPTQQISVGLTTPPANDALHLMGPSLSFRASQPVGVYAGTARNVAEITALIQQKRSQWLQKCAAYGELDQLYQMVQPVLAWNTIYDPQYNRVITPVSRAWTTFFGGPFVLFCWDTYLAAYMIALDQKELAYANLIAITKEAAAHGFVPNYTSGLEASTDRSQPPIGSLVVKEVYKKYREDWLLEHLFDDLLAWNRWWPKNRKQGDLLSWGSNPGPDFAANTLLGAKFESGLDNSPLYDDMPFDTLTHLMALHDVGLNSLYIADCRALEEIALILGREPEATELKERGLQYAQAMESLWDEETRLYLNKRTDTRKFSTTLSPTHFYPLLAHLPDEERAKIMVDSYLTNPNFFDGNYLIPSVSKNHPAYREQDYWRGRIWGPMNFLVYLGLRNYGGMELVRKKLVDKSVELLEKNWQANHWVYENYEATQGVGRESGERPGVSDNYYHWGALLGFMAFIEQGLIPAPETPAN